MAWLVTKIKFFLKIINLILPKSFLIKSGYEIDGFEKIPREGPAILVLYHSTSPLDGAFLLADLYLKLERKIPMIILRDVFKFHGYKTFLEALEHLPGSVDTCVSILRDNQDLLALYPGGMKEQILPGNRYDVILKKDAGFAKIAQIAKVV